MSNCTASVKQLIQNVKGTPYGVLTRKSKNGKPQSIEFNETVDSFAEVIKDDCKSASRHGRFSDDNSFDEGTNSEVCEQALAEEAPCFSIGKLKSTPVLKSRLKKSHSKKNDDYDDYQKGEYEAEDKMKLSKTKIVKKANKIKDKFKNDMKPFIDDLKNFMGGSRTRKKVSKVSIKKSKKTTPMKEKKSQAMQEKIFYATIDNSIFLKLDKIYYTKMNPQAQEELKKNFKWNPYDKVWKAKTTNALQFLQKYKIPEKISNVETRTQPEEIKVKRNQLKLIQESPNQKGYQMNFNNRNINERLDKIESDQKAIANVVLHIKPKVDKIERDMETVKNIAIEHKTYQDNKYDNGDIF